MDNIKMILLGIVVGIRDAILGIAAIYRLDKARREQLRKIETTTKSQPSDQPETVLSRRRAQAGLSRPSNRREEPRVIHRILQCSALNGGVFWLSILGFHHVALPCLQSLMNMLFGGSPGLGATVWEWMNPVLLWTFSTLWVLPLFLLSRIVNSLWFQDIADSAYRHLRGRPQLLSSISKLVADVLFSLIIQVLFLIQSTLVGLLPIYPLGELVGILHLCLLYSLYAFEYKWFNMGWELHRRLSFLERNWPYFVGFGLPLALLTSLPSSYLISGCVFSILFPLFIVSGNEATPMTGTCDFPLQLFSGVVYLSNALFHRTIRPNVVMTPSPVHLSNTPPQTPTHELIGLVKTRHRNLSSASSSSSSSSTARRKRERVSGRSSSSLKD